MSVTPRKLAGFLDQAEAAVLVEIAAARGSTPREAGAWMAVGHRTLLGTIGGGQLELLAVDHARRMLDQGMGTAGLDIPLGPEISQCCGGRVELRFERLDEGRARALHERVEAAFAARPHVYVFGAGHVGNALARAFALLPYRIRLLDTREGELAAAPEDIEKLVLAVPEAAVRAAPPGAAFVILTHEHSLDFLIAREALARRDTAYVGMIGSATKKATFRHWFVREGGDPAALERLTTPIGGGDVGDKRPEVIAALAAAEVARALARWEREEKGRGIPHEGRQ